MAVEVNHQLVRLTASQAQVVQSALQQWSKLELINPNLVLNLLATIQIIEEDHGFPWQSFAKYTFGLAILSFVFAILSISFGDVIPKLIKKFLDLPLIVRIAMTACVAVLVHTWGYQRSLIKPEERYLNEAIHCVGAFILALSALQLATYLEFDKVDNLDRLKGMILGLASTYGFVAAMVNSNLVFSCGIIFLGIWLCTISGSCLGVRHLGSRYPIRFVLLGISTIFCAYLMRHFQCTALLWSTARIWGMLYLFNALWSLSLFDSILESFVDDGYEKPGSGWVYSWSLALTLTSAFSMWHGLQFRDSTTHGFGIVYLSINLCTKYIEFFWHSWYKSVFFTVLALLLALLGRYAEHMNILHMDSAYAT